LGGSGGFLQVIKIAGHSARAAGIENTDFGDLTWRHEEAKGVSDLLD
jgi:hypothetical protein